MSEPSLETRMAVMETKMDNVAKDLSDEKVETKKYREIILERLAKQDRIFWMGIGGLMVVNTIIVPLVLRYLIANFIKS